MAKLLNLNSLMLATLILLDDLASALVRCIDEQQMSLLIGLKWQQVPGTPSECDAQRWCVRVKGDGRMYMGEGVPPSPFQGTLRKCARTNNANRICDNRGAGCHLLEEFDPLSGNLTVCCCRTARCNRGDIPIDNTMSEMNMFSSTSPTTTSTSTKSRTTRIWNTVSRTNQFASSTTSSPNVIDVSPETEQQMITDAATTNSVLFVMICVLSSVMVYRCLCN